MLVDYHIHSSFSPDSESSIIDIVSMCKMKGIKSFIITDHIEVSSTQYACSLEINEYRKEMEKFSIPVGVEIGWDGTKPVDVEVSKFDYVLFSHHVVDEPIDDNSYVSYLERLNELMRKFSNFHALAHLDFPRRYHKGHRPFSLDTYDLIKEILNYVIENGKFLEVNTQSIPTYGEPNPSKEILKIYKELGGMALTLGSDAHKVEHIGRGIKEGIEILKDLGYNYIMTLNFGWEMVKI